MSRRPGGGRVRRNLAVAGLDQHDGPGGPSSSSRAFSAEAARVERGGVDEDGERLRRDSVLGSNRACSTAVVRKSAAGPSAARVTWRPGAAAGASVSVAAGVASA